MGKVTKSKREKVVNPPNPEKCPKAWEKARRDRMKVLFEELSRLLPKFDPAVPPSRPEIIQKATELIRDLQAQNEDLLNGGFDEIYKQKLEAWKRRVKELLTRVEQLTDILRTANIHVPPLALQGVPSWTVNRPKHWTEKVQISGENVEDVLKQLSEEKKKASASKAVKQDGKVTKTKKKIVTKVSEVQCKENKPTVVAVIKNKGKLISKKKSPAILQNNSVVPVSISQASIPQPVPIIQNNTVGQTNTFILTNQGSLLPVLTPSASVLTPVIINRPPPLVVLQSTPPQPRQLPVIISRPPANKKRIDRESTVMTFANKRPIAALSKHSHTRRGGKCVAHKISRDTSTSDLLPIASSGAPAVSPTAAFLNSFPVVATPKVIGSDGENGKEGENEELIVSADNSENLVQSGEKLLENPEENTNKMKTTKQDSSIQTDKSNKEITEKSVEVDKPTNDQNEGSKKDSVIDIPHVGAKSTDKSDLISVKTVANEKPEDKVGIMSEDKEIKQPSNSLIVAANPIPFEQVKISKPLVSVCESSNLPNSASSLISVKNDVMIFPQSTQAISNVSKETVTCSIQPMIPSAKEITKTNEKATETSASTIVAERVSSSEKISANLPSNVQKLAEKTSENRLTTLEPKLNKPIITSSIVNSWEVNTSTDVLTYTNLTTRTVPSTSTVPEQPNSLFLEKSSNVEEIKSKKNEKIFATSGPTTVTSSVGTINFAASWTSVPLSTSNMPSSSLNIHPSILPSSQSCHTSCQNWIPLPPVYTNEKFNKNIPASTWRPGETVWPGTSKPLEPWKPESSMTDTSAITKPNLFAMGTSVDSSTNLEDSWKVTTAQANIFDTTASLINSSETWKVSHTQPNVFSSGATTSSRSKPITATVTGIISNLPSLDRINCETTWSSGITTPVYATSIPNPVVSSSKTYPVDKPYMTNSQNTDPFTSYKSTLQPVQSIMDQSNPWNCPPYSTPLPQKTNGDNCQVPIPKLTLPVSSSGYQKNVNKSSNLSTATSYAYDLNNPKSNIFKSQPSPVSVPASLNNQSNSKGAKVNTSGSYSFPNSSICSPFNMNAYPPQILKTTISDNSYSSTFNTFTNDPPFVSKPPFSLDVTKAFLTEPPYSLAVPKTPSSDSIFFSNVPIYQSASSNILPTQSSTFTVAGSSKNWSFEPPTEFSAVFPPAAPSSTSSVTQVKNSAPKESSVLYPPPPTKNQRPPCVDQKMNLSLVHTTPGSDPIANRTNPHNAQKNAVPDPSTARWNSSYFPQTGTSHIDSAWNQLDLYCPEGKDNRPKPPINWMTDPEHNDDTLQPRYQNIFERNNILDFCFNNSTDDENVRNKARRKETDPSSQDYTGWMSMKVDPLVVPCTLPTLVGDLALGSDPVPAKRCKTNLGVADTFTAARQVKQTPQEPFTNLSKNIFDMSQSEPSKTGNLPETIVLKNIFELPPTLDNKQKPNQGQNSFLSVSQLVEPRNIENTPHKSDYTYYSQRSGKGKRASGWKCGEKKCQQSGKSCSSYSAEALLRTSENLPTEQEFSMPNHSVFPIDYPNDSSLVNTNEIASIPQHGKPKMYASRARKQDYWRGPEFKGSQPSANIPPSFLSSTKVSAANKTSELPFTYPSLSDTSHSNLHFAPSSTLPYNRFPSTPVAPLLPTSNFPEVKAETPAIFPPSPGRPADPGYSVRYAGPRKPCVYARSTKVPYSYNQDPRKNVKNIHPPSVPPISSNATYLKSSVGVQSSTNPLLGSPLSISGTYSSKPNVQPNANIESPGGYSSKSLIQQSINPVLGSPLPNYSAKPPVSIQQSSNPMLCSPMSTSMPYPAKPGKIAQIPTNNIPNSSYLPKPGEHEILNRTLPVGSSYPHFPPLPQTPGSSGSSLANFNLTTIFPEMNKKAYQYT